VPVHFWLYATHCVGPRLHQHNIVVIVRVLEHQSSCRPRRSSTLAIRASGVWPRRFRHQFARRILELPGGETRRLVKTMNFMKSRRATY
jgi:hypothetical protein